MSEGQGQADKAGTPVKRTATAKQVAAALTRAGKRRSKRSVQDWAGKRGCPHDLKPCPGGHQRLYNVDEVKAWAEGEGLWSPAPPPDPHDLHEQDLAASGQVPADELGLERSELELRLRVMSNLRRVCDLVEQTRGQQTPQALASLSRALAQASAELRAVEKDSIDRRERLGELIERIDAEETLVEAALMFVDDLDRLEAVLPQLIVEALTAQASDGGGVTVTDGVGVERRLGALVGEQIGRLRQRRHDEIRTRLGEDLEARMPGAAGEAA